MSQVRILLCHPPTCPQFHLWSENQSSSNGPEAMNGRPPFLPPCFLRPCLLTALPLRTLLPSCLFLTHSKASEAWPCLSSACPALPQTPVALPSPPPSLCSDAALSVTSSLTALLKYHSTLCHTLSHFCTLFFSIAFMPVLKYKFPEECFLMFLGVTLTARPAPGV